MPDMQGILNKVFDETNSALKVGAIVGDATTLDGYDSTAFVRLAAANTFTTGPQTLKTGAAGNVGLIVQGAASQTADLKQYQDSAAAVLGSVSAAGAVLAALGSASAPGRTPPAGRRSR